MGVHTLDCFRSDSLRRLCSFGTTLSSFFAGLSGTKLYQESSYITLFHAQGHRGGCYKHTEVLKLLTKCSRLKGGVKGQSALLRELHG